jgi:hypothetical protein
MFPAIAMMIGAYLANEQAQQEVSDARNQRSLAETINQQKLGKEADARMRESLAQQERPVVEQNQAADTAIRQQKYDQQPTAASDAFIANPSAPKEVKSEIAARMVDAMRRGRQQSQALARLGGTSDAQFTGQTGLLRSGQDLNRIGGMSRASSAILPYELQDANRAGEGWRTVSDLFNIGSMGYGLYNMAGTGATAGGGGVNYP